MRLRLIVTLGILLLVSSPASADFIDMTDLSTLPADVTLGSLEGELTVTVDGVITRAYVDTYLRVNGIDTAAPYDFITGTLFVRDIPDTVLGGYEVAFSSTEFDLTDNWAPLYGINYLRVSAYQWQPSVTRLALADVLGVEASTITFGFQLTGIEYTPTNVPEPSTLSLLSLAALFVWRRHR